MSKRSQILEIMWLIIAIVTLIVAIFESLRKPFMETYPLFIVSFISFFMFMLRKKLRKNNPIP